MKTIEISDQDANKILKMQGYNPEQWSITVMEDENGDTIGIIEPREAPNATSPTAKVVNLNKILKNLKKGDDSMDEKTLDKNIKNWQKEVEEAANKGIKNWQKEVEEAANKGIKNWQKEIEEAADKGIEAFEKSMNTK